QAVRPRSTGKRDDGRKRGDDKEEPPHDPHHGVAKAGVAFTELGFRILRASRDRIAARPGLAGLANYGFPAREVVTARAARRTLRDLLVERRVDLGNFLRLARLVWLRLVVQVGLAAEVEALETEAVCAVRADLLERREQLLLGRRPRVGRDRAVHRADVDRPVPLQARRRRDQLPDDDVLLQTKEPVDLALDRRVREHLRRLLEGGGGEERLGGERRLRDAEDERLERRLLVALLVLGHTRV